MKRTTQSNRRTFLTHSLGASMAFCVSGTAFSRTGKSPNEKLNVGFIGVSGRGNGNLSAISQTENVAALCDVDEYELGRAAETFPKAQKYRDFRKMLEQKDLDAVAISTPDHIHAAAALAAIERGSHVYCEKPLAHSVFETRAMTTAAKQHGVVTQMGNQLHATGRLRRAVELVRAGVIGPVQEVHAWSSKFYYGGERPVDRPPVPERLHWDLWLGPAAARPYHPTYLPFTWRGWWAFGSGCLGDMACHIIDAPYWALGLGYPTTITPEGPLVHPESAPKWLIVRYEFPARGSNPPVKLVWYDGTIAPPQSVAERHVEGTRLPDQGSLMIGEKGSLLLPHVSGEVGLFPKARFANLKEPAETLPRVTDHHAEWTDACKGRGKTLSSFDYAGPMTETVLAGVVAYRAGKKLEWDGPNLRAANCPEADALIHPQFRSGWFSSISN